MKQVKTKILVLIFAIVTSAAFGQVAEKKGLTIEGAREVITAAVSEAKKLNAPGGVIAVVDEGGNLMALERLDGTFAAGANISVGKARTAALFKRPTKAFEEIIRNGRTPMVALNDFTPLQGGVPIEVEGEIVGAVGVSGASSAQQDEDLAIAGANALKTNITVSSAVTYLDSAQVKAAFAKGMPLLEVGAYKIHASHRDGNGMAEVHVRDTDIIYVLEGSAKFITGGTVIDGKTTAENEIRGASIQGGEERKLVPGDVIVVPNGIPHWFKEVKAPFNYYVVKVVQ